MRNLHVVRVGIAILLNFTDLVVAFFLILGGWNATVSHPVTGYAAIAFATILLYLSVGLWTKGKWKRISRIVLYGGAVLIAGGSAIVLISTNTAPLEGRFVVYLVMSILLFSVLLSIVHFRLLEKEGPHDLIEPTP